MGVRFSRQAFLLLLVRPPKAEVEAHFGLAWNSIHALIRPLKVDCTYPLFARRSFSSYCDGQCSRVQCYGQSSLEDTFHCARTTEGTIQRNLGLVCRSLVETPSHPVVVDRCSPRNIDPIKIESRVTSHPCISQRRRFSFQGTWMSVDALAKSCQYNGVSL